ncbi:MAG: 3'-5' exonuclease [Idiomarina sp.]|nr:3'-5' exonuclease [Idiomarina sp.]
MFRRNNSEGSDSEREKSLHKVPEHDVPTPSIPSQRYSPPTTDWQRVNWQERFQHLAENAHDPRLKKFYQAGLDAGITDANMPISEVPMMVLDFETTGLNAAEHGILSIGAIPMNLHRISQQQARMWLAKPRRNLPAESIVIHGITHSQIQQAPDFIDILEEVLEFLAGRLLIVHYQGIERPFLAAAIEERIGERIEFPVIDTMHLEARLHRQKQLTLWQRFRGAKPVSIRLADSRTRYGLPWYHPHDAITDALATGELLQAQIAHHYSPNTTIGELWS